jgi:hypothetical protein
MEQVGGLVAESEEVDVEFLDGERGSFDEMFPEGIFCNQ